MQKRSKIVDFNNLLARQEYLVVQSNDLVKSFGNLKAFEHKILDFCVSYVQKESKATETFQTTISDILKHFSLNASGQNYMRVAKAFKKLNENTALYFAKQRKDGKKSIIMGQLFHKIEMVEDGRIEFQFSDLAAPYIFELQQNFYTLKLRELSMIKSKYTMIMLKLIEAKRFGDRNTINIEGTVEEFKEWFLGKEKAKNWTTARFTQQVLNVALKEIESKIPLISSELSTMKYNRKVIGYQILVTDNRKNR